MKKGVRMLQFNSHLEGAWQPPKSFPIPISLTFSKGAALLLEVGALVTHPTFSESDYVYDHIFNYSREHMLMLIHLLIEEHCESREPYGFHLQRGKRCVKFLTPLAPNKIRFTSTAGHSFGASKTRAGTRSQHSVCIPSSSPGAHQSCRAPRAPSAAPGVASTALSARRTRFNKCLNLSMSCVKRSSAA